MRRASKFEDYFNYYNYNEKIDFVQIKYNDSKTTVRYEYENIHVCEDGIIIGGITGLEFVPMHVVDNIYIHLK